MRARANVETLPQLDARYREQSPTRPNSPDELFARGVQRGRDQMREEVFEFLRAQAALHRDEPGDAQRRGALNLAADLIRDGREVGRP